MRLGSTLWLLKKEALEPLLGLLGPSYHLMVGLTPAEQARLSRYGGWREQELLRQQGKADADMNGTT